MLAWDINCTLKGPEMLRALHLRKKGAQKFLAFQLFDVEQPTKKAQFPYFSILFPCCNGFNVVAKNQELSCWYFCGVPKVQATGLQCASPGDAFPGVSVAMEATGWHPHCGFQHPETTELEEFFCLPSGKLT